MCSVLDATGAVAEAVDLVLKPGAQGERGSLHNACSGTVKHVTASMEVLSLTRIISRSWRGAASPQGIQGAFTR